MFILCGGLVWLLSWTIACVQRREWPAASGPHWNWSLTKRPARKYGKKKRIGWNRSQRKRKKTKAANWGMSAVSAVSTVIMNCYILVLIRLQQNYTVNRRCYTNWWAESTRDSNDAEHIDHANWSSNVHRSRYGFAIRPSHVHYTCCFAGRTPYVRIQTKIRTEITIQTHLQWAKSQHVGGDGHTDWTKTTQTY